MRLRSRKISSVGLVTFLFLMLAAPLWGSDDKNIIELWEGVKAPAPVELKPVKIESGETAFLILDIEERTCNPAARPRCLASVPKIKGFLDQWRSRGLAVVYSLTSAGKRETILPPVTPQAGEPIVQSSVDKFYNTDLERILRERGIKTVIIAGTAAEGAVLHTATGAAMRGFQIIVPVDGMSASNLYAEQYTAWHLLNAPGTRGRVTLTRFDLIRF